MDDVLIRTLQETKLSEPVSKLMFVLIGTLEGIELSEPVSKWIRPLLNP